MTYDEKQRANQTKLAELKGGRRGGWRRFITRISNHTRSSQTFPDAELTVQVEVNPEHRNDLGFWIEETFETAAGNTRTTRIGFTLKSENVAKLREILAEIDVDKTNP